MKTTVLLRRLGRAMKKVSRLEAAIDERETAKFEEARVKEHESVNGWLAAMCKDRYVHGMLMSIIESGGYIQLESDPGMQIVRVSVVDGHANVGVYKAAMVLEDEIPF